MSTTYSEEKELTAHILAAMVIFLLNINANLLSCALNRAKEELPMTELSVVIPSEIPKKFHHLLLSQARQQHPSWNIRVINSEYSGLIFGD